jgi:hypothetical protein
MTPKMYVVWKKWLRYKEQSTLHDWSGKLVGEGDWAKLSAKFVPLPLPKKELN